MNKSQFLSNMVSLRKEKGLTQEELAAQAKLSLKTVSNFEKGSFVSIKTIKKIAPILGVTVKRFYTESYEIS